MGQSIPGVEEVELESEERGSATQSALKNLITGQINNFD